MTTATIQPDEATSKDASVRSDSTGSTQATGEIGRVAGFSVHRLYLEFDISAIPAGATISSATLDLTAYTNSSNTGPFAAHACTSAWAEGSVTWASQPSVEASASATSSTSSATKSWDLTTLVGRWVSGALANNGVQIREVDETTGSHYIDTRTAAYATAAQRPKLTINYVYETGGHQLVI